MIQIVMRPEKAPVVNGEGLYEATFGNERIGFRVRARNAREAERKLMIVFRHELTNKVVDFRAEDHPLYDKEKDDGDETEETEESRPECGRAQDKARPAQSEAS